LYGCETIALQAVPGFSLERPNEGVTSGASDPVGLPAHGLNLVQLFLFPLFDHGECAGSSSKFEQRFNDA
jgi:hypothetical protein